MYKTFYSWFSLHYFVNFREKKPEFPSNDTVIIKDNGKSRRLQWKKGTLPELIIDRSNNVRGAVVSVFDNNNKKITLKEDYNLLIPLKLARNITDNDSNCDGVVLKIYLDHKFQ